MNPAFVLDKASILDRLGGDEELFGEMVSMFLGDAEMYCSELASAIDSGDLTRVQREAHTIKGVLATFSDDPGAEFAHALEVRAKNGEGNLAEAAATLAARVREVARGLQQ